jgi:hypothetical protein
VAPGRSAVDLVELLEDPPLLSASGMLMPLSATEIPLGDLRTDQRRALVGELDRVAQEIDRT